ncbi:penicillin-binding protein [bacterium]|nr:penicillin-binding protein [bacterium]
MRAVKISAISLAGLFLSVLIFAGIWVYQIDTKWSPVIEPRLRERQQFGSIRILAKNPQGGTTWITSLSSGRLEERKPINLSEAPPLLIQAVVMLEDPRFLSHEGFDVWGILRAAFAFVRTMRFSQGGGSTITQQLVKNIFLTNEQTFSRKFVELIISILVENRFSKDEILEAYINEIYLGQLGPLEVHGIGRAAEYYFSKPLDSLELHEMALLAAVIASPGYYSPWKQPERALSRRKRVLNTLWEANLILEEEFIEANRQPLPKPSSFAGPTRANYLADALRSKLIIERGEEALLKGGFDVVLSLDLELQKTAEASLRNFIAEHQGLEGLALGVDPRDCSIKVYAGGSDYRRTQLDRIIQGSRPIGSLMKPLEIIRLLDRENDNLNLATTLEDRPLEWNFDKNRGTWSPENYDKKFRGNVRLRDALELSLNVPIVRVFFERFPSGLLNDVLSPVRALGLKIPPERALPSAVLGAIEQRPWDVALAFTKLTRQSLGLSEDAADFKCRLHFELDEASEIASDDNMDSEFKYGQEGANLMTSALQGALRRGTSIFLGNQLPKNQAWAGKTGTSSDQKDSWYAALSPELVLLTWVGNDNNTSTKLTGASGALRVAAPVVLQKSKTESLEGGWQWPSSKNLVWDVIEKERACLANGFAVDDFKLSHPDPIDDKTGLPFELIYKEGRTFAWELFLENRLPEKCSSL